MHQNELFAVRNLLERHRRLIAEADQARASQQVLASNRAAIRRQLASVFARLAERLDPERTMKPVSRLAR